MFRCSACLRRAVLSLSADLPPHLLPLSLPSAPSALRRTGPNRRSPTSRSTTIRAGSTLRSIKQGHHRKDLVRALTKKGLPPPNKRRNQVQETKVYRRDREASANNDKHLAVPDYQKKLDEQAQTEAIYLVDPLRLADEVQRNLKSDGFDKAFALVRASEKQGLIDGKAAGTVNNIVSWNHLCDWCMAKSDPRMALKIYNEMKKRGHRPDSHTYTIMLRGFGNNIRKPNAVADAMKVYQSMFEPSSKIKPNTIHTNAIINVCAKGSQMDSLWSVTGRLPDKGLGSADHVTYTTILKAIERDAITRAATYMAEKGEGANASDIFGPAVEDGRKLWRDVVIKWRRADLRIDESLVCAMGRLLLLSKKRNDVMDVFRLVEQTMGVRPKHGLHEEEETSEKETERPQQQGLTVFSPVPTTPNASTGRQDPMASKFTFVQPGNNTLSMLMEASLLTKQMALGKSLWFVLTSSTREHQITPDSNNVVAYLRLLRFSRASADVLAVLSHDWPAELKKELNRRGVYIIAMSTCVRDKNNPSVFKVASKIIDLMQTGVANARNEAGAEGDEEWQDERDEERSGLLDVDPQVMAMYLNLAMYTTKGINVRLPLKKTQNGDLDFEREAGKNNTMRALHRMGPDTINLNRLMKMKMAEMDLAKMHKDRRVVAKQRTGYEKVHERLEDLMGLVKAMVSAYDRILAVSQRLRDNGRGPLSEEIVIDATLNKAKLGAYLSKIDKKLYDGEGRGRSGLWQGHDPVKIKDDDISAERQIGGEEGQAEFEEDGDVEVQSDTYLQRTPGGARFKKLLKKEEKSVADVREKEHQTRMKKAGFKVEGAKRLSRRQKQEGETERREDRRDNLRSWEIREGRTRDSQEDEKRSMRPRPSFRSARTVGDSRRDYVPIRYGGDREDRAPSSRTESGSGRPNRPDTRDRRDEGARHKRDQDGYEKRSEDFPRRSTDDRPKKTRFNAGIDSWVEEQWQQKRKDSSQANPMRGKVSDQVQRGWGAGYADLARESGRDASEFIDLRR